MSEFKIHSELSFQPMKKYIGGSYSLSVIRYWESITNRKYIEEKMRNEYHDEDG